MLTGSQLRFIRDVDRVHGLYLCECGNETTRVKSKVRRLEVKSCGCAKGRPKHGRSRDPVYQVWSQMKYRCTSAKAPGFHRYGGRGITYDPRWEKFENFAADMGPRPEGYSLERVDNNRGYEPANCKWASSTEQSRNRSTNIRLRFQGETLTLADWANKLGLSHQGMRYRLANFKANDAVSQETLASRDGRTGQFKSGGTSA